MSIGLKNKNTFSFNIRILDSDNNYKKIKDIFIRKQDIYLIKLLEKRTKNNKNSKMEKSLKKIIQSNNLEKNVYYKPPKENKLIDFKNIRIKKKLNNSIDNNNYILEKINEEYRNNKNQIEDHITSKIYNIDSSRNNKTMLNAHNENNLQLNNNNFLKTINENENKNINKYNKTALNLINSRNNIFLYQTNIKLKKNNDNNYTKYKKTHYNNLKLSLNKNSDNLIYDKKIKIKNARNPIYAKIFNKINLTEEQNDSYFNSYIKKECCNSKDKAIQFHKIFNLFKKENQIKDNNYSIKLSDKKKENQFERNINKLKINYSLNKDENIKIFDRLYNFNNGLPYINKIYSKN